MSGCWMVSQCKNRPIHLQVAVIYFGPVMFLETFRVGCNAIANTKLFLKNELTNVL